MRIGKRFLLIVLFALISSWMYVQPGAVSACTWVTTSCGAGCADNQNLYNCSSNVTVNSVVVSNSNSDSNAKAMTVAPPKVTEKIAPPSNEQPATPAKPKVAVAKDIPNSSNTQCDSSRGWVTSNLSLQCDYGNDGSVDYSNGTAVTTGNAATGRCIELCKGITSSQQPTSWQCTPGQVECKPDSIQGRSCNEMGQWGAYVNLQACGAAVAKTCYVPTDGCAKDTVLNCYRGGSYTSFEECNTIATKYTEITTRKCYSFSNSCVSSSIQNCRETPNFSSPIDCDIALSAKAVQDAKCSMSNPTGNCPPGQDCIGMHVSGVGTVYSCEAKRNNGNSMIEDDNLTPPSQGANQPAQNQAEEEANPNNPTDQSRAGSCPPEWRCGDNCADSGSRTIFESTWCNGSSRWRYEDAINQFGDPSRCGGSASITKEDAIDQFGACLGQPGYTPADAENQPADDNLTPPNQVATSNTCSTVNPNGTCPPGQDCIGMHVSGVGTVYSCEAATPVVQGPPPPRDLLSAIPEVIKATGKWLFGLFRQRVPATPVPTQIQPATDPVLEDEPDEGAPAPEERRVHVTCYRPDGQSTEACAVISRLVPESEALNYCHELPNGGWFNQDEQGGCIAAAEEGFSSYTSYLDRYQYGDMQNVTPVCLEYNPTGNDNPFIPIIQSGETCHYSIGCHCGEFPNGQTVSCNHTCELDKEICWNADCTETGADLCFTRGFHTDIECRNILNPVQMGVSN